MSVLHPIILISFPGVGEDIIDGVIEKSFYCNDRLHSNFIKHIKISETGVLSCNDDLVNLEFSLEETKENNFTNFYNKRSQLFDFINQIITEIYNQRNQNIALDNNFSLDRSGPKIIFLSNLTSPLLLPVYFTVLRGRNSFYHKFTSVSLLLTTQNNNHEQSEEGLLWKVSFFKEIEAFNHIRPSWDSDNIWIADKINDESVSLDDASVLYKSIAHFLDILYFNNNSWLGSSKITEQGKLCLYSSFGVSTLIFPVERVKDYMNLYLSYSELSTLIQSFDKKFGKAIINSSLKTFFRKERWTDIHGDINKDNNEADIYKPFTFNSEKELLKEQEETARYNLQLINSPKLLSKETTTRLLSSISDEQKTFLQTVESDYEQTLFRAKERELKRLKHSISSQIETMLDKDHRDPNSLEGINYAILFCSLLNNNESEVMHLMSDSTHVEYDNLYTIQDEVRELCLGDELRDLEKKEKVEKDDFTDKKKLIEKYTLEIASNTEALETLRPDSARFIVLCEENKAKEKGIDNLNQEIILHKKHIKDYSDLSNNIRLDFDKDEFRRSLREDRTDQYDETDKLLKENLEINDNDLAEKYDQKNIVLETRKKILFRDVFLIPTSVLIIFILFNTLLIYKVGWFYDFFRFFSTIKYRILISILIPFAFLLKGGYKWYSITKKIKSVVISIKKAQLNKTSLFLRLVNNFDDKTKYKFSFQKNLYAYNMLEETIEHTKKKISDLNLYKTYLKDVSIAIKQKIHNYEFTNSSFDFCVFQKQEVENICDNEHLSLINKKANFNLSDLFLDYLNQENNVLFDNLLKDEINHIYEEKVNNISVTNLLLNQAIGFDMNVEIQKEIQRIYNHSRPLLKTTNESLQRGVPSIKNIIIGKVDQNIYNDYFMSVGLNNINYNESLDAENTHRLGVLSIKSNLPGFFIQNLINEELSVKKKLEDNKNKYFTTLEHSDYRISPILGTQNRNQLNEQFASGSILLLLYNIISYSDHNFRHDKLHIASDFEALGIYLNSADGEELYDKMNQLMASIDNWSEDEQNDFISLTSSFIEANRDWVQQNKNYFEHFLLEHLSLSDLNFKRIKQLLNEL